MKTFLALIGCLALLAAAWTVGIVMGSIGGAAVVVTRNVQDESGQLYHFEMGPDGVWQIQKGSWEDYNKSIKDGTHEKKPGEYRPAPHDKKYHSDRDLGMTLVRADKEGKNWVKWEAGAKPFDVPVVKEDLAPIGSEEPNK